jgi:hypothetical protein
MPRVGFESTITVFELAKTVHALDHVTTVTGGLIKSLVLNLDVINFSLIKKPYF